MSRGPVVHYLRCDGPVRTVRVAKRPPFVVRDLDGKPVMRVTRITAHGILRGDGKVVTAARFADGRAAYCSTTRKDRAAAVAVGFAFTVVAFVFGWRWLRTRRSRDPFDRAYR